MILGLFRHEVEFKNIRGYDDINDVVRRAIDAENNYNLLFIGPPASAKTLFLLGMLESKKGVYFDGSNATNRILDVLEEKRAKIICIDELQEKLLNFMESGNIKVDQMRRKYDFRINGAKVFAACNEISRLSKPLQSRFRCLYLPRYSEEQFPGVSIKVLPKLKIAHVIGIEKKGRAYPFYMRVYPIALSTMRSCSNFSSRMLLLPSLQK
jgi:hypothetical protein